MKARSIVITDDSVINSYGFRVLTDGGDLSEYVRNPVLLYDHVRRTAYDNNKDIILPIGRMTDLRRVGSKLVATPEFDLQDQFAVEISRKYEADILNMASIGYEPVEVSADPAVMLPGQQLPTVTKWKLKEVSITDIGANPNCTKLTLNGQLHKLNGATRPEEIHALFDTLVAPIPASLKNSGPIHHGTRSELESLIAEALFIGTIDESAAIRLRIQGASSVYEFNVVRRDLSSEKLKLQSKYDDYINSNRITSNHINEIQGRDQQQFAKMCRAKFLVDPITRNKFQAS